MMSMMTENYCRDIVETLENIGKDCCILKIIE